MTATLGVFVLRLLPLAAVGFVVGLLSLAGILLSSVAYAIDVFETCNFIVAESR